MDDTYHIAETRGKHMNPTPQVVPKSPWALQSVRDLLESDRRYRLEKSISNKPVSVQQLLTALEQVAEAVVAMDKRMHSHVSLDGITSVAIPVSEQEIALARQREREMDEGGKHITHVFTHHERVCEQDIATARRQLEDPKEKLLASVSDTAKGTKTHDP